MSSFRVRRVSVSGLVMALGTIATLANGQSGVRFHQQQAEKVALETGIDEVPPRITGITPQPGARLVDNVGISVLEIRFDEVVTVPAGSVVVSGLASGLIGIDALFFDDQTRTLTIELDRTVLADVLTVVVDYSVVDSAGNALDGEIAQPIAPLFPSGDNAAGGRAVVRYEILQGDVDRNGLVDEIDGEIIREVLGESVGSPSFDSRADLNNDGFVNVLDVAIWANGLGGVLPTTDGVPPSVVGYSPDPSMMLADDLSVLSVFFSERVIELGDLARSFYAVSSSGQLYVPSSASMSVSGESVDFVFDPPLVQCEVYEVWVSNSLTDQSGAQLELGSSVEFSGLIQPALPSVELDTLSTTDSFVHISGVADGSSSVEINSPSGVVSVVVDGGSYSADVSLRSNQVNHIFITGVSQCGARSAPVLALVTQDEQAPEVFIEFPSEGARIESMTTDVFGRVGDMLSGFEGLSVQVNGQEAAVDISSGTNGTFFVPKVELETSGETQIFVVATDALGNQATKQLVVSRSSLDVEGPVMRAVSGGNQTGTVGGELPLALEVLVLDDAQEALVNKVVAFEVVKSDGLLAPHSGEQRRRVLQVRTDSQGIARVFWTLGSDGGMGNNRVVATSTDVSGTVVFSASALAGAATRINLDSGNNQSAQVGAPLLNPFRVFVHDGQNGVAGVPVTFSVVSGLGEVDGQAQVTVETDLTGHAQVGFVTDIDQPMNRVTASFPGNTGLPATFVATGVIPNAEIPTSLSGVVLDNTSRGIGGAVCDVSVNGVPVATVLSDLEGRFTFNDLPPGPAKIHIDGLVATTLGGEPIEPGLFPSLGADTVIVAGAANKLAMPILLPMLNPANARMYDTTQDVELVVQEMEGLKLTVRAGTTVSLPDGSVASPSNPVTLSLNQVHFDEIPMPMPNGSAPRFAWTLQPGGATFDPPLTIEMPNVEGLPVGAEVSFASFDHAVERFLIVATGSVSEDGSVLRSAPGSGLSIAGWGGGPPPPPPTGEVNGCDPASSPELQAIQELIDLQRQQILNQSMRVLGDLHDINETIASNIGSPGFIVKWESLQFCAALTRGLCPGGGLSCAGAIACVAADLAAINYCGAQLALPIARFAADNAILSADFAELAALLAERELICQAILLPDRIDSAIEGIQSILDDAENSIVNTISSLNEGIIDLSATATETVDEMRSQLGFGPDLEDGDFDILLAELEQLTKQIGEQVFLIDSENVALQSMIEVAEIFGPNGEIMAVTDISAYKNTTVISGGQSIEVPNNGAFSLSGIPVGLQRIRVIYSGDDAPYFGQSEFFDLGNGDVYIPSSTIEMSQNLPTLPVAILLDTDTPLLMPGQQSKVIVTAEMSDGGQANLQTLADGTVYRSTNPAVAMVDENGLVTAVSRGTAFIAVSNQGATATHRITVAEETSLTTVSGICLLPDGSPAVGAEVSSPVFSGLAIVDSEGVFTLSVSVPSEVGAMVVQASLTEYDSVTSSSFEIQVDGLSDAGILRFIPRFAGQLFPAPVFQTENSPPVDVVIDDWNVDGFPDLLVANRFVVGMFLGDGNGGFRVRQDIGIESGNDNRQIQSADLNNDGIPDLVVTTRLRMVYVLLGIGDGTFSPRQGYEAGLEANSVAIGDLNGDGAPDLAVTSFNENSLSVFIGNGDGTFQPRSILSTGARAYWVAIADINLDGSVDIAVAKSGGNAVYLGNGDGSFQDRLDLATGHSPGSIALDDVNADGNPDLVSTDLSIDMVSVQLGMGDGGFAMRQDYQVGVQPQSVVVSDLDDNGTLDVTVVNTGSNSTTTLLGDGAGGFSGRIDHPAGRNPRAVSIGDIDLDGALDLALTNGGGSNVSVIFGRGDGTLITRQNYVVGGSGASSLETADFNGDSVVDLVSANTQSDSVSVLLGSSDGSFGDPLVIPTGTDPLVVAVGDFDNNGTPDVSVANLTSSSVSIILGNGDGTFQNRQDIPSLSGAHDVAVGNLDGDGNADLLVATRVGVNNFIHVLLGNGDGTFQSSLVLGFGQSGFGSIRVVDVNGDQHSDIVIPVVLSNSVRTLLGNGDGTFQTAMSSQAGSEPQTLTSGDVDGDGILDLAVSVRNGVNILLGSGDGFFQLSKSYLNGSNGTAPLELEDFNGDGVLDLVVANTGASVQVLLGMGDGSFGAGQSYQTGVGVTSVAVQDFNGDGAMDVASLDSNDQSVSILLNQRVQQSTLFAGEGGSSAHKLPFARGIVRADRYPADVDAKESEQVGSSVHRGLSGNHSALGLTRGAVSRSIRIHAREVRILAQAEANVLLGSDDRHHPKSVLENAIGQVVEGRFDGSTGFTSAVLIDTDGKEIRLPALGAQGSMFPVAINPRGDVIGFSSVGEGWVWRYAEPVEIESIGTLGGRGSVATFWLGVVGVLGQADTPDGSNRAILWVPGDGLLDMSRFVEDQRITLDTVLGVLPGGVVIASGSDEHGHKVVVSIELVLSESVLGDVDGNGLVDEFDARLVMELIEDQNPVGDLNSDGVMDMRDLALVIRNLGMSSSEIEIESGR